MLFKLENQSERSHFIGPSSQNTNLASNWTFWNGRYVHEQKLCFLLLQVGSWIDMNILIKPFQKMAVYSYIFWFPLSFWEKNKMIHSA